MTIVLFYPRIHDVFRHRRPAFPIGGAAFYGGDVAQLIQEVEDRLDLPYPLERLAVPHCRAAVEFLQMLFRDHLQDAVSVLEHGVLRQHIEDGLGVVQEVPSQAYALAIVRSSTTSGSDVSRKS